MVMHENTAPFRWYEQALLIMMSGLLLSELTSPSDKSGLGWIKIIVIVIATISTAIHVLTAVFIQLSTESHYNAFYIRNQGTRILPFDEKNALFKESFFRVNKIKRWEIY